MNLDGTGDQYTTDMNSVYPLFSDCDFMIPQSRSVNKSVNKPINRPLNVPIDVPIPPSHDNTIPIVRPDTRPSMRAECTQCNYGQVIFLQYVIIFMFFLLIIMFMFTCGIMLICVKMVSRPYIS